MGTGWRRAFCTSIPRDSESDTERLQSPKSSSRFGFFSNPSTPRFHTETAPSPRLFCRTKTPDVTGMTQEMAGVQCKSNSEKSPRVSQCSSVSSSPRTTSRFSLFKSNLRLPKRNCGVCMQSVKHGKGTASFTGECSHCFHFPCIVMHVRKNRSLTCPVCNSNWKEVPFLTIYKQQPELQKERQESYMSTAVKENPNSNPRASKFLISSNSTQRIYSDDEALSHASGVRFNTIPETEEEDEGLVEFKDFFQNSSPSSSNNNGSREFSDKNSTGNNSNSSLEVKLLPDAAIVSLSRNHESYIVSLRVKASAPTLDITPASNSKTSGPLLCPFRRAPIDLVTVLDLGLSMNGDKLNTLKRAMRLVVSSLGPSDRLSIVAFSAHSKRLLPLTCMTVQGQRTARRIVDQLNCSRGSSSSEALRKAAKVLEDRRERNPVASIMLLSDGQDEGIPPESKDHCHRNYNTRFGHVEIPAKSDGDDESFAKCVGGLLSVVAQDIQLQLRFSGGEILAVYSCGPQPFIYHGSDTIRLGDLYAEEERELLVELRSPANMSNTCRMLHVTCCYRDPSKQDPVYCKQKGIVVPNPFGFRYSTPKIERMRNLYVTTRAAAEARRLANRNDFGSACQLLSSARSMLLRSELASTEEDIRNLESVLAEIHSRRLRFNPPRDNSSAADELFEPLTPGSSWRVAEQLANVAVLKKSLNRVSDLHGFENARF